MEEHGEPMFRHRINDTDGNVVAGYARHVLVGRDDVPPRHIRYVLDAQI